MLTLSQIFTRNAPVLWCATGGRPMRFISHAFTDMVSGQRVNLYRDKRKRYWLAESPWSGFRVECKKPYIYLNESNEAREAERRVSLAMDCVASRHGFHAQKGPSV